MRGNRLIFILWPKQDTLEINLKTALALSQDGFQGSHFGAILSASLHRVKPNQTM